MRKLALNPDELVVQSFPTQAAPGRLGTVRGMDSASVDQDSCNTCEDCSDADTCVSCPATCANTCQTCPVSCYPANCPSADGRPTCDLACSVGCPSADGRC